MERAEEIGRIGVQARLKVMGLPLNGLRTAVLQRFANAVTLPSVPDDVRAYLLSDDFDTRDFRKKWPGFEVKTSENVGSPVSRVMAEARTPMPSTSVRSTSMSVPRVPAMSSAAAVDHAEPTPKNFGIDYVADAALESIGRTQKDFEGRIKFIERDLGLISASITKDRARECGRDERLSKLEDGIGELAELLKSQKQEPKKVQFQEPVNHGAQNLNQWPSAQQCFGDGDSSDSGGEMSGGAKPGWNPPPGLSSGGAVGMGSGIPNAWNLNANMGGAPGHMPMQPGPQMPPQGMPMGIPMQQNFGAAPGFNVPMQPNVGPQGFQPAPGVNGGDQRLGLSLYNQAIGRHGNLVRWCQDRRFSQHSNTMRAMPMCMILDTLASKGTLDLDVLEIGMRELMCVDQLDQGNLSMAREIAPFDPSVNLQLPDSAVRTYHRRAELRNKIKTLDRERPGAGNKCSKKDCTNFCRKGETVCSKCKSGSGPGAGGPKAGGEN